MVATINAISWGVIFSLEVQHDINFNKEDVGESFQPGDRFCFVELVDYLIEVALG